MEMAKYLDLDDVAKGNPKSEEELSALRASIAQLEADNGRLREALLNDAGGSVNSRPCWCHGCPPRKPMR